MPIQIDSFSEVVPSSFSLIPSIAFQAILAASDNLPRIGKNELDCPYEMRGQLYFREKTPAEVVGERVIRPLINVFSNAFSKLCSIAKKFDSYFQFPGANANPIEFVTCGVGDVVALPHSFLPATLLECNGQVVRQGQYPKLYEVIGVSYGIGTESSTFRVPDYRGMFLRGQDRRAGADPDVTLRTDRGDGAAGDVVGSRQSDALQRIQGSINGEAGIGGASGVFASVGGGDGGFWGSGGGPTNFLFDSARVVRSSDETRPKNVNIIYAIRTECIKLPATTESSLRALEICSQSGSSCFWPEEITQAKTDVEKLANTTAFLQRKLSSLQSDLSKLDENSQTIVSSKTSGIVDKQNHHETWLGVLTFLLGINFLGLLYFSYKFKGRKIEQVIPTDEFISTRAEFAGSKQYEVSSEMKLEKGHFQDVRGKQNEHADSCVAVGPDVSSISKNQRS